MSSTHPEATLEWINNLGSVEDILNPHHFNLQYLLYLGMNLHLKKARGSIGLFEMHMLLQA